MAFKPQVITRSEVDTYTSQALATLSLRAPVTDVPSPDYGYTYLPFQSTQERQHRLEDRSWPAGMSVQRGRKGEAAKFIPDNDILAVNFSARDYLGGSNMQHEIAVGPYTVQYGVTPDNRHVLQQGAEHSGACTAEAMLLLDVIHKYDLDKARFRPQMSWVVAGIDGSLEYTCDSLANHLRGTNIEIEHRRYDFRGIEHKGHRRLTSLQTLAELINRNGPVIVGVENEQASAVIIVDKVDLSRTIPIVTIREPMHGWQITVFGLQLADKLGGSYETIQAYKLKSGTSVQIAHSVVHGTPLPAKELEFSSPLITTGKSLTRNVERLLPKFPQDLKAGDVFVTSLNGTQRLVIAEDGADDESTSLTVLVKKRSASLGVQSVVINRQSLGAVMEVIRQSDKGSRNVALDPFGKPAENPVRIDRALLENNPVIISNAEILLGHGLEGATLNRNCELTTVEGGGLLKVKTFLDCSSGRIEVFSHTASTDGLVPLTIIYEVSLDPERSDIAPGIDIVPGPTASLKPDVIYNLRCSAVIAAKFMSVSTKA